MPMTPIRLVRHNLEVPALLYGTAWKEERTASLVGRALEVGFRGFDTANQRKHYHEAGVGEALQRAMDEGLVTREALFLQSKFTSLPGQDHRLPYDPRADRPTQVRQSFGSTLEHLGIDRLDSLVLHGPSHRLRLTDGDWQIWRTFEALQTEGRVRVLGVSNVIPEQLEALCAGAVVLPAFVQNRCYARDGWDAEVRAVADAQGVVYQGFSLLTANRRVWSSKTVASIAARLGATPAQVVLRFAQLEGMLPLTGTTDPLHMAADLRIGDLMLTEHDRAELRVLR